MTEKSKGKKLLTWTLALSMTLALPPVGVFAEDGAGSEGSQQTNSALVAKQPDGSSKGSEASNNKGDKSVSTSENGGQNIQTAPPSGTLGTSTPSGEEQKNGNETLTPLLAPVSGEKTEKGEGNATSKGKDENKDETTGEVKHAATINGTQYDTLEKAIEKAENGDTVVLAKDVTENININKSITLDLNGKTLTAKEEGSAVITITENVPEVSALSEEPVLPEKALVVTVKNGEVTGGKNNGNGGGFFIENADVTLEKLTITENAAAAPGSDRIGGGGIYAEDAVLALKSVHVTNNMVTTAANDGGGILIKNGFLTIEKSTISGNTAPDQGGGMVVVDTALELKDSEVSGNHAAQGAGIFFEDSNKTERNEHTITNTDILSNEASNIGGGIYVGTRSNLTIQNSTLKENKATAGAGQGGAIACYFTGTIGLNKTTVTENAAISGGGIYVFAASLSKSTITLENGTHIDENEASYAGGGIYLLNSVFESPAIPLNFTIKDSSVNGNTAPGGAGIYTESSSSNAPIDIDIQANSEVCGNKTNGYGGGIYANTYTNLTVAEGVALYNNTASTAGDDLFLNSGTTFTLPKATDMSGDKILTAYGEKITGWFYDGWVKPNAEGTGWHNISRWGIEVDGSKYYDEYTPSAEETTTMALKAAYKPAPPSGGGGGGGGGHRPKPKPTVEIPDDDALGLNNTDHFAYIVGYGNGEVQPQNSITRAEVAAIFFRLLEDGIRNENFTHQNDFSDVAADAWYCSSVSTLSRMGIIAGYPDGTFRPNAPITRAEFAAIATRFDNNGDKTPVSFTDIIGHWAEGEITVAANHGWVSGYGDNTFRPQNQITRAETMSLVNRVLKRLPETPADLLPDMITWTDNADTSSWYYLPVQEATNSHYYEFKENSKYEKWTELRETRDWSKLG